MLNGISLFSEYGPPPRIAPMSYRSDPFYQPEALAYTNSSLALKRPMGSNYSRGFVLVKPGWQKLSGEKIFFYGTKERVNVINTETELMVSRFGYSAFFSVLIQSIHRGLHRKMYKLCCCDPMDGSYDGCRMRQCGLRQMLLNTNRIIFV